MTPNVGPYLRVQNCVRSILYSLILNFDKDVQNASRSSLYLIPSWPQFDRKNDALRTFWLTFYLPLIGGPKWGQGEFM